MHVHICLKHWNFLKTSKKMKFSINSAFLDGYLQLKRYSGKYSSYRGLYYVYWRFESLKNLTANFNIISILIGKNRSEEKFAFKIVFPYNLNNFLFDKLYVTHTELVWNFGVLWQMKWTDSAEQISRKTGQSYSDTIGFIRKRLRFDLLRTCLISLRGFRGKVSAKPASTDSLDLNLHPQAVN